jgi:DNA-directed RNA polymerase subunit beta'
MVENGEKIKAGKVLKFHVVLLNRRYYRRFTRITELLEARNPSNPAVVSEIDGVSFGKIKRGNREIIIESKFGDIRKYLVKLSSQILVQENDFVRAGVPLSDGAITPEDILRIKGQLLFNSIW